MRRSEITFKCLDCYKETCNDIDHFNVYDYVWLKAVPGGVGHLCLRCLRVRLRRNLDMTDFNLEWEVNEHINPQLLEKINEMS